MYKHTSVGMSTTCSIYTSRAAVYIMSSRVEARLLTTAPLSFLTTGVPYSSIGAQVNSCCICSYRSVATLLLPSTCQICRPLQSWRLFSGSQLLLYAVHSACSQLKTLGLTCEASHPCTCRLQLLLLCLHVRVDSLLCDLTGCLMSCRFCGMCLARAQLGL